MGNRKIIEIYAEEDNDKVYFDIERIEDTQVANAVMHMISHMFNEHSNIPVEIEYKKEKEEKENG